MMLGCRPRRTRRIPRRRTERREKTAPRTLRTGESIADFESAVNLKIQILLKANYLRSNFIS